MYKIDKQSNYNNNIKKKKISRYKIYKGYIIGENCYFILFYSCK